MDGVSHNVYYVERDRKSYKLYSNGPPKVWNPISRRLIHDTDTNVITAEETNTTQQAFESFVWKYYETTDRDAPLTKDFFGDTSSSDILARLGYTGEQLEINTLTDKLDNVNYYKQNVTNIGHIMPAQMTYVSHNTETDKYTLTYNIRDFLEISNGNALTFNYIEADDKHTPVSYVVDSPYILLNLEYFHHKKTSLGDDNIIMNFSDFYKSVELSGDNGDYRIELIGHIQYKNKNHFVSFIKQNPTDDMTWRLTDDLGGNVFKKDFSYKDNVDTSGLDMGDIELLNTMYTAAKREYPVENSKWLYNDVNGIKNFIPLLCIYKVYKYTNGRWIPLNSKIGNIRIKTPPIGTLNPGNACYILSVIQQLCNLPEITTEIMGTHAKKYIDTIGE